MRDESDCKAAVPSAPELTTAASQASRPRRLAAVLPLLPVAAVVAALSLTTQAAPHDRALSAGILIGFAILSWAFGLIAEPATSLLFFLLGVTFHIARPEVIFSGFTSTAWWLVFGGSIIAVAVQSTGLGQRLADLLFGRLSGSYRRSVAAVAIAAVALAFLMPSTNGRILLLMPIVLAFAERIGLKPGQKGYTGLVVAVAAASYMPPTTILTANVPNSVLLGAAESFYGIKLTYGSYLLLHFPVLGALKAALIVWLACRLFPERAALAPARERGFAPLSPAEKRLMLLLGLSLILFATDFIHGISPAWISLGTGILCLLPPVGVITPKTLSERINVGTLIYIAGILGLGAVVSDSGLGRLASAHLLADAGLVPGHTAANLGILAAIGCALGAISTLTGLPAVLTALAGDLASASGLPLLSVLMLQVISFSTVILPFESPPMMIALQLGGVGVRPAAKLCLALTLITVLVLWPLDYLWWQVLGYLP